MISVVVLTKNEARDIEACLQSVSWCNDIHIVDSGSSDDTVEIAIKNGARVASHPFESFGKQRNYALDHLDIKNEWILFLDADEVITDKFKTSIFEAVEKANSGVAGFYCCWKMILEGRWLKYCDNYPKWQFRLMQKGKARFKDFGHGQKEDQVCGEILYIKEPYLHFGFSKGWQQWIDRHNRYSSEEAVQRLTGCPPFRNVFSKHSSLRNPALKSWLSRVPGWPLLRFIQAYFFNLGFLEGSQGFIYCINMSYYEFLIQIKMREIKNRNLVVSMKS